MAYGDDFGDSALAEGQSGSSGWGGLAQNPLMPIYDPLYSARVNAAPEASVPTIHTQGMAPQQIMRPSPVNVPDISGPRGGGEAPNQLQPSQAPPDSGLNMNSLQGLLQLKGMEDLIQPSALAPGPTQSVGPGAGAGPGRAPAGAVIAKAAAPYQDMVNDAAKQNGVDAQTLTRLLYKESQFDPKAVSPAGAKGIGQFMDATAKEEGVDVNDPKSSIYGSAKYLAKMTKQFNNNEQLGMAAYNWGPGNLQKWLVDGADPAKLPAETRDYVNAISGRPLAPNMYSKAANIPSAAAAPMAATIAATGGGFAVPPGGTPKLDLKVPGSEETLPVTGGAGNDQGTPNLGGGVSQPQRDPGKIVPGPTPPMEQNQPQQQAAPFGQSQTEFGSVQNDAMRRLWQYMLIKSLFPQIQFRNIGYDPWAVHRFGQGGGY
jgi:soluble lytic murein transglycosylase-like protein